MLDAILGAFGTSSPLRPVWYPVQPYLRSLFWRPNHSSLHRVITLTSPYISWDSRQSDQSMVSRWVAATSAVAYTEAVGQSVISTLFQIAADRELRPHIPVDIWTWLKKRPSLPPVCLGRHQGGRFDTVRQIRGLGDIEILKSHFLLVWSEWDYIYDSGLDEMEVAISKDFGGIGMWCHREDLIERLDYVLGQLERGSEFLHQRNASVGGEHVRRGKEHYGRLKERLLEVDGKSTETLTRKSPQFTHPTSVLSLIPMDTHRIPLDIQLCSASFITPISS